MILFGHKIFSISSNFSAEFFTFFKSGKEASVFLKRIYEQLSSYFCSSRFTKFNNIESSKKCPKAAAFAHLSSLIREKRQRMLPSF
jgi:hypothetical protein